MASFGSGKSVPNQGGVAKANTAPSRVTADKSKGGCSTPGIGGGGHATSALVGRVKPVGGTRKPR